MPRDGSNNYAIPPGTDGIPDTTIESTKYNAFIHDIEFDQNNPRPIIAGGTGANNATAARANLRTEVAAQAVTNYDTHPFENGSFYSLPGATNAPTPNSYHSGVCHMLDPVSSDHCVLTATEYGSKRTWVRVKSTGVWEATWREQTTSTADADARYVNVTGDTMTGNLTVNTSVIANAEIKCGEPYTVTPGFGWSLSDVGTGGATLFQDSKANSLGFRCGTSVEVGYSRGWMSVDSATANVTFHSVTASSSPTTGALGVVGGVGIGGALRVGSEISVNGGIIRFTPGGDKYLYYTTTLISTMSMSINGTVNVNDGTGSTSPTTGALVVAGGVGIGGKLTLGNHIGLPSNGQLQGNLNTGVPKQLIAAGSDNNIYIGDASGWGSIIMYPGSGWTAQITNDGALRLSSPTGSSSTTTGALIVAGGIGCGNVVNTNAGLTFGQGALTGFYGDGTNIAIRTYAAGATYFQTASGGVGLGDWNATRLIVSLTTASSSPTSGALVINGGVGVGQALYVSSYGIYVNAGPVAQWGAAKMTIAFDSGVEQGIGIISNNPGLSSNGGFLMFASYTGALIGNIKIASGSTVVYNTSSDRELKEDERKFSRAREIIDATEIWDFKWKDHDTRGIGVFGQDAYEVFSDAVSPPALGAGWMVDYSKYVPVLLAGAKEMQARIDALEQQLNQRRR